LLPVKAVFYIQELEKRHAVVKRDLIKKTKNVRVVKFWECLLPLGPEYLIFPFIPWLHSPV
jgi:hypothetical protein